MKAVLLLLLFFVVSPVYGQTVLEEIQGYEPFYISHYGRHGSWWLSR